ncbi:MAG: hypothetical protein C0392_09520 [Syntrophus sp. (in: bacteria)]|nr:hypothetical protein [Syntrophus sp. (in: bacteria)]
MWNPTQIVCLTCLHCIYNYELVKWFCSPSTEHRRSRKKESVTVRYSIDVLDYFRSTGPGWQTRIDAALKNWVARHRQDSGG